MKKAMLFIVALLFSVSASAATMSWVSVPVIDSDNSTVQITGHEGYAAPGGSGLAEGYHIDDFSFAVSDWMQVGAVAIEFYDDQIDILNAWLDGTPMIKTVLGGGVAQWVSTTLWASPNFVHHIIVEVNEAYHGAQISLKINAVPVPAALFLFAPALLGFLGLRRKAKLAA